MVKQGIIYLLANKGNNVLYCGVTSNLEWRVAEHKLHVISGFTSKYNCNKLVYFELHANMKEAIEREKQIKNWKREWKDALINAENPLWKDLSESIGVDAALLDAVMDYYRENKTE